MIDFSKFYNNLGFVAALYRNNLLSDADIRLAANILINNDPNDILVQISLEDTGKAKELFEKYLSSKALNTLDAKRELTKFIFQYVLDNQIDMKSAMEFVNFNISEEDKVKEFIGDDIGVEHILGNYWLIEDGDVCDDEVPQLTETINEDMRTYIQNN